MASTPKAPDPKEQAEAQNSQSSWASMWNNISGNANTSNPYGQTNNTISGYVAYTDPYTGKTSQIPQWTQTTTLSPEQQAIYNQESQGKLAFGKMANSLLGNVSGSLSKPLSTEGMQSWRAYGNEPGLVQADEGYRRQMEDKMAESYRRGITPQYDAEDAQLAARGQSPGGKMAYATQQGRYDAADEAARQRFTQAGGEARNEAEARNKVLQQTWLNSNLSADQSNALRQQQLAEATQLRTQPLNELLAMFGLGQTTVPNAPGFQGSPVNAFNVAGAMDNEYKNQLNAAAATNAGIFGLGGDLLKMLLPFSDRRAKTDIKPIGALLAGVPLYTFKYWLDGVTHVGVMADEAKALHPDAVHMDVDGYDHVDYAVLSGRHDA